MSATNYQFVIVAEEANGVLSIRYCNDLRTRTRVLAKHGIQVVYTVSMEQQEHIEECMHTLLDSIERDERVELVEVARIEAERLGFTF